MNTQGIENVTGQINIGQVGTNYTKKKHHPALSSLCFTLPIIAQHQMRYQEGLSLFGVFDCSIIA